MELRDFIPRAHRALDDARDHDRSAILEALRTSQFVGIRGESEVGKSSLTARALKDAKREAVTIDLDGAASEAHLAWIVARALARHQLDPIHFSLLSGAPDLAPSDARGAHVGLVRNLGAGIAALALSSVPDGSVTVDETLQALARVAAVDEHLTVWVDHVETPELTPRHPVDSASFLWALRAIAQQQTSLTVLATVRTGFERDVAAKDAAFYMDGTWVHIDRPSLRVWEDTFDRLGAPIPEHFLADLVDLLESYPPAMLLALGELAVRPEISTNFSPESLVRQLASSDDGAARLAVQYARTLHRLGGDLLTRIADGSGPYVDRAGADAKEIHRALQRLHRAGLISQTRPTEWGLSNPLIAMRLRGTLRAHQRR